MTIEVVRAWLPIGLSILVSVLSFAACSSSRTPEPTATPYIVYREVQVVVTATPAGPTATPRPTSTPGPKPTPTPIRDGSAIAACTHFFNIVEDGAAGILSDSEIRTKFKEVYDAAKVSRNKVVGTHAQQLLRAVTQFGSFDADDELLRMADTCAEVLR